MLARTDENEEIPRPTTVSGRHVTRLPAILLVSAIVYSALFHLAEVEPARLLAGFPRLLAWAARAWPPDFSEPYALATRAAETLAMATLGTTLAALLAVPVCVLSARNVTPHGLISLAARAVLNVLRGIDSFVFALLFVAAVGLGPFAGLLGIGLHSAGSIAKLWAETIETAAVGPVEAARLTGASTIKVLLYALLPDVMPSLVSTLLYVWEFNVRASTVLGIVGAGGIGQELKNNIDLLAFPRVFAIILVILGMVTFIDQVSAWLRRRVS